jgi:transglutaminase-like putative cysteine protease
MMKRFVLSLVAFVGGVLLFYLPRAWGDPWTQAARYSFEYRVDLDRLPTAPERKRISAWVPYPAENVDQKLIAAEVESPWEYRITEDRLGNRMLYLEGHQRPEEPLVMRFTVERSPSQGVPNSQILPGSPLDPQRYLHAPRLVPLEGVIRKIAEQESRGLDDDEAKVRAFYEYVVRTMRYSKNGTGWGRGDAIWACTKKRGNCTDFHSLFIGMALSQGVPARFVIGFPIPMSEDEGPIPGYHCWAEYYDRSRGWVPLDSSEAKNSGRIDAYFGQLPNDRIQFTVGRDLLLNPPQQGPPLNYFIYPYVEVEGKPVTDVAASFRFRRLPTAVAQR